MFNLKNLIIAALSPIILSFLVVIGGIFSEILKGVWGVSLIYVGIEHILIGKLLGMDPNNFPTSGGFLSFPFLPWLFALTVFINYLVLVLLIYFLLTLLTKLLNNIS